MTASIDKMQLPSTVFDGTSLPISEKVKNLGILIDKNSANR